MAGVARVGDIVGKGGILTFPFSSSVTVNDRPIALFGCMFTPHPPCSPQQPQHCFGVVLGLDNNVSVEGMIPLTGASIGTCGDKVLTSSSDVIIAGGLMDLAVSLAAGQASPSSVTALESIAISSAGQIMNGQNIGDVTKGAAVQYGVGQAAGAVVGEVKQVLK